MNARAKHCLSRITRNRRWRNGSADAESARAYEAYIAYWRREFRRAVDAFDND